MTNSALRRPLSLLLFLLSIANLSHAASGKPRSEYFAYIGTYTNQGGDSQGIYVYRFDSGTQKLTPIGLAAKAVNPSFLAVHPNQRFLYAVNEVGDYHGDKSGGVSAFAIDHATGKLTLLNEVASHGTDPCYITVDKKGKYVLVANYTSGSIAVFPIRADGSLGEASTFVQHTGHGTNPQRQEGPHAHSVDMSPDNRFAIVDDLGLDETIVYKFGESASLTPDSRLMLTSVAKADAGSGPRHFAFSPNGKFGYVLHEMASTITAYRFDAAQGTLKSLQTISSIPTTFTKLDESAEIEVAPSGKFLYASNRGHDSIAVFAINPSTGMLTLVEYVPTKGESPRNFEIAPGGALLFAANEKSDNIVLFRVDRNSGRLTATGQVLEISQPVCVRFARIE